GFTNYEYAVGGKYLELLKQIAPEVTRVAVLRDPAITSGVAQFAAIQAVAPSLGIDLRPADVREPETVERAIPKLAQSGRGGLIVPAGSFGLRHRELIVLLAARNAIPAVYYERIFVTSGGLLSYGPDLVHQYRQAAGYIDRILKGASPADLPVQAPTKYELV